MLPGPELFCRQGGWLLLGSSSSMELDSANSEKKVGIARDLCEQGLWPDVLAFAQKWREKNPAITGRFITSAWD